MKTYKPDGRSLLLLRILIILTASALTAASELFLPLDTAKHIISALLMLAGAVMIFVYFPLYFSHLSYSATDKEIKKSEGVLFRRHESIKYSSIQYSVLITTPFSKRTGFNFIILYVYGGKFLLMFLKKEDAEEILENSGCLYCQEES